jgi:putative ABC transport system substrate-binding protein
MYPAGSVGSYLQSMEMAGHSLGVRVVGVRVSDADAMKAVIEAFATEPNGGLIPSPAIYAIMPPDVLSRLALRYRLPAISAVSFAANGGLMGDSIDTTELYRGAATYVDRLLRGAKVSDLPVQYPTKFRLVINLKTAKALGLEVSSSILVSADEVIE